LGRELDVKKKTGGNGRAGVENKKGGVPGSQETEKHKKSGVLNKWDQKMKGTLPNGGKGSIKRQRMEKKRGKDSIKRVPSNEGELTRPGDFHRRETEGVRVNMERIEEGGTGEDYM